MTILNIVHYPNDILSNPTKPVEKVDQVIKRLVQDMFETMYNERGLGLAANQVGEALSIFVMDLSKDKSTPLCFINPEVVESKGEVKLEEGCLSFPGVYAKVKRPEFVKMRALDINGEVFEHEGVDYDGRCMLHELDHLKGITFFDRLSPLKRKMLEEKYFKRNRERL